MNRLLSLKTPQFEPKEAPKPQILRTNSMETCSIKLDLNLTHADENSEEVDPHRSKPVSKQPKTPMPPKRVKMVNMKTKKGRTKGKRKLRQKVSMISLKKKVKSPSIILPKSKSSQILRTPSHIK